MGRPLLKGAFMLKYLVKRILQGIIVLFGVILITFILSTVIPADPARTWAGAKATDEQIAAARIELGLDKPVAVQFYKYIKNLLQGDFGTSYVTRRSVATELATRIPATLEMVFYGSFIGIVLGLVIGVLTAKYKDGPLDHIMRFLTIGSVSCPGFVSAIILQLVFYNILHILPLGGRLDTINTIMYEVPRITGWLTIDTLLVGNMVLFKDAVLHLIMPAMCLAPFLAGTVARMTRSNLLEILGEDYILAAKSYGVSSNKVLWHHALKNSIGTTATVTSLALATTLVGTFLVEAVFSWPGIGSFVADSVTSLDYPSIMGATIFTTLIYLVLNLLADIIIALDPRVTL